MARIYIPLSAALVPLLLHLGAGTAGAQVMSMAGSCSGQIEGTSTMISGKVYLEVPVPGKSPVTVAPQSGATAGGIFNLSECQCQTQDIRMQIFLDSPAPRGPAPVVDVWAGTGDCVTSIQQTQTPCEKLPTKLTYDEFLQRNVAINTSLPAHILTSPRNQNNPDQARTCEQKNQNAIVNLYIGAANDKAQVTCSLTIPVRTIPPTVSSGNLADVRLRTGSRALEVDFPTEVSGIERYQILCRNSRSKEPVAGLRQQYEGRAFYSTCVNGVNHRRIEIPGATGGSTPGDGGTSTDGGAAVADPLPEAVGQRRSLLSDDGGAADDGGGADGGADAATATKDDFDQLDPRYICTDKIQGGGSRITQRVEGLEDGESYDVKVVAIDYFGNATAFDTVTGTPKPTVGVIEGTPGLQPGFGCSTAGGSGLPAAGAAGALLGLLALGRRRRGGAQ